MDLWWQLPGPRRFVSALVRDLRDGRSCVVCLPRWAPPGVVEAVRSHLDHELCWTSISLDSSDGDPADVLFGRLGLDLGPEALRTAEAFARDERVSGRIICVDGISRSRWPSWSIFLDSYADASRERPLLERSPLIIVVEGDAVTNEPEIDLLKAVHTWRGAVDRIDLVVYASELTHRRKRPNVEKRLANALLAAIAVWDRTTVEALADERIETLLEPWDALASLARDRGWPLAEAPTQGRPSWALGLSDLVDGREQWHSAHAASDAPREIQRRLWTAQVSELLPAIEEQRRGMIGRLENILRVPHRTRFDEVIEDLRDLEVGHIEHQLGDAGPKYRAELRRVRYLRKIRNALSHLEPVSADLLLSEDLGAMLG